jgi:DNA processing protein
MSRVIAPGSEEWPALLDEMHPLGTPERLYVRGHKLDPEARRVGIVGTRRPSLAGLEMARRLAGACARNGFVVVSGMALGIDAAAHASALDAGGSTIAVLGCGADVVYPRGNKSLYERLAARATIVSEYSDGTPPEKWRFPQRNRVIAGMCEAVVVVEGALKSGALITARLALDANRDVFAVPGSPMNPRAEGANELIRTSQASLVLTPDHLFEEIAPEVLAGEHGRQPVPTPPLLDEAQRITLLTFDGAPLSLQALLKVTDLDAGSVGLALMSLELRGFVSRRFGAYELTPEGMAAAEALLAER